MVTTLNAVQLVQIHLDGIAQRGTSPFEDPRTIARMADVLRRRGETWAQSVLGRTFDRRSLINPAMPWLDRGEAEILVLADEAEARR